MRFWQKFLVSRKQMPNRKRDYVLFMGWCRA